MTDDANPIGPADLNEMVVAEFLSQLRSYRDASYLCRAYLQFGPESMSVVDIRNLCAAINKARDRRNRRK